MSDNDTLHAGGIAPLAVSRASGGPMKGCVAPLPRRLAAGSLTWKESAANDPINWWLIGCAFIYLFLSYFAIGPSIWVRSAFASLLILRMRADIIIPLCLSCLQLRLNVQESFTDLGEVGEGVVGGLTGFESYAFALPPLLISLRAAVALPSDRVDKRGFPYWLYFLWLFGAAFVVVGAFVNLGTVRGWTGGMRMYSIVGAMFYGLLMPRPSPRQIDRLVSGLAIVGLILFGAAFTGRFGSKVLFALAPVCVSWGISGILSMSGRSSLFATIVLVVTSLPIAISSTFTVFGAWSWAAIATLCEFTTSPRARRPPRRMLWFVAASAVFIGVVFVVGINRPVSEKLHHDGTVLGRIEWKLYADRAPLWWGCFQSLCEEPSLLPTPEREFLIEWFGSQRLWPAGPHNLFLELLNQLGMVAGPIAVLVLTYLVCRCAVVLTKEPSRGIQTLAITTIAGVLVGGLTLPYMVQDRIAEHILFATGLAFGTSTSNHQPSQVVSPSWHRA